MCGRIRTTCKRWNGDTDPKHVMQPPDFPFQKQTRLRSKDKEQRVESWPQHHWPLQDNVRGHRELSCWQKAGCLEPQDLRCCWWLDKIYNSFGMSLPSRWLDTQCFHKPQTRAGCLLLKLFPDSTSLHLCTPYGWYRPRPFFFSFFFFVLVYLLE